MAKRTRMMPDRQCPPTVHSQEVANTERLPIRLIVMHPDAQPSKLISRYFVNEYAEALVEGAKGDR